MTQCLLATFINKTKQTQLQILTAVVKLFLKKPNNSQGLVQKVLQAATAENDNPDIRDRAYVYWRLLSGDLDVAKVRFTYFVSRRVRKANIAQRILFYPRSPLSRPP
jgi:vesicle coat complex subunit